MYCGESGEPIRVESLSKRVRYSFLKIVLSRVASSGGGRIFIASLLQTRAIAVNAPLAPAAKAGEVLGTKSINVMAIRRMNCTGGV